MYPGLSVGVSASVSVSVSVSVGAGVVGALCVVCNNRGVVVFMIRVCVRQGKAREITERPHAPLVGSQHSFQSTVKPHGLPLVWIFPLGKGEYGGAGGSSWNVRWVATVLPCLSSCCPLRPRITVVLPCLSS